jgi:hypothetical protein
MSSSATSPIVRITTQAALLGALSNIIAQGLTAYQDQHFSSLDPTALLHFVLLAIVQTPPNYLWQKALEDNFPSKTRSSKKDADALVAGEKKSEDAATGGSIPKPKPGSEQEDEALSITNTTAKFLIDQTLGAAWNTVFFIVLVHLLKGQTWGHAMDAVQKVCME